MNKVFKFNIKFVINFLITIKKYWKYMITFFFYKQLRFKSWQSLLKLQKSANNFVVKNIYSI